LSFSFPSKNAYSSAGLIPPPSHLTFCTPTKSILYLDSSLETVCLLYETSNIPCTKFHIHISFLGSFIQRIRPGPRLFYDFCNEFIFYGEGILAPRPTPKLEDHPLSFVWDCLFNIFAATLHSWRPFLHPQPEDMPCCGDRDPPNMVMTVSIGKLIFNAISCYIIIFYSGPIVGPTVSRAHQSSHRIILEMEPL
jgi:hypothetical protein